MKTIALPGVEVLYVFSCYPTMVVGIPCIKLSAQFCIGQSFFFSVSTPPVLMSSSELIIRPVMIMIAIVSIKPVIGPGSQLEIAQS